MNPHPEHPSVAAPTRSLDLGCGAQPRNPFGAAEVHGVDLLPHPSARVVEADLVLDPIPFGDGVFDFVTAHDFIEHVPRVVYAPRRRNPFVELMNEVWRVLKPSGRFLSVTPAFPHPEAFQDPTHVNVITEKTFFYFEASRLWAAPYGFRGAFHVTSQVWDGPHLRTVLTRAG